MSFALIVGRARDALSAERARPNLPSVHELLTSDEMNEADRLTMAGGISGLSLMERAGAAVAEHAARLAGGEGVVIVAGPGNNGGDGYVAARLLAERGVSARLFHVGDRSALKGDAARVSERWQGPAKPATPDALKGAGVIVDALFGAGLDRPVTGLARAMIEAMNATGAPILAVDLPSGVNGTTGQVLGAAVRARESVTFFRRKPGHLLMPGRLHCGAVHVVDIGIPDSVLDRIRPNTFHNAPALWGKLLPFPALDGHKYSRGHAVVVSGPGHATGAARLAARGALRIGAGLVSLASPADAIAVNAAASLAVMVKPADGPDGLKSLLADRRFNAVVLGPGLGVGEATREMVHSALDGPRAVVIDADALTSFDGALGELAQATKGRAGATVLTPHEGEFARLFGSCDQGRSKLDRSRAAATATGAVVVLKGPDTVVAAPDGRAVINDNAPPWLATAGTGDVLAGFVAGLLAQGMPAFEAASAAVWLHGAAGQDCGLGLISEDLTEALPAVLRRLHKTLRPDGSAFDLR